MSDSNKPTIDAVILDGFMAVAVREVFTEALILLRDIAERDDRPRYLPRIKALLEKAGL